MFLLSYALSNGFEFWPLLTLDTLYIAVHLAIVTARHVASNCHLNYLLLVILEQAGRCNCGFYICLC